MEYSVTRSTSNLTSTTNHLLSDNVHSYGENANIHSNDVGMVSPVPYSIYDEKQQYQHQNQAPSLNQLLQNNQYVPYGNAILRPQASSNYWNLPRSQNETTRMYYTQYQDTFPQHINDVGHSKVDKMKCSDQSGSILDRNYVSESRQCQKDEYEKARPNIHEWKSNKFKSETLCPKDNLLKSEADKVIDQSNSIEIPDSLPPKPESHLNMDYNSNTPCSETSEKNDVMCHNSNYTHENKVIPSQVKNLNQAGYENQNFAQAMMHQNINYYTPLRYPNPQNNNLNYMNNNNSMMPNSINRQPMVNYPPYMQPSSQIPGYGYHQNPMHQSNVPYNMHGIYAPSSSQSPFAGHQDIYMNGSSQPIYSGSIKEDKKEDTFPPILVKQDAYDSGSTSTKSATARSSKSKNAIKSESHPTTPVSNTIPSPSQTSMSSMLDENDDSVSSLGPNDSNLMHHPVSQFNPHTIVPNISQNQPMIYPQQYPPNNTNQIPNPVMGPYPGHMPQQTRPFAPVPNITPSRQYHQQNDSPINNSCFQKLLELGSEPERGPWIERYLKFMHENNTGLSAVPTVVKQPLDLFRLYHAVRERGGLLNVVKTKRWKEICLIVNVNASASGAYTLRRNYIKCLLDYECRFDRNGVDPGPILQEIQSLSDKKKKSTTKTTGSSSSSTISSGPASQHNSEFMGNQSTPRPSLPAPEFSPSHGYPGSQNHYVGGNNPLQNGAMIHRSPMHYPTQRSPYPGQYPGPPRMMGYSTPPSPLQSPQIRYDVNTMSPNWPKPGPMNQQQWSSPSQSSSSSTTCPMQVPMSPGTPTNISSTSSQQSQQVGSLQEHTRRMDWKSNYGGMPPPPVPPPPQTVQAPIRGALPMSTAAISQTPGLGVSHPPYHHSNMPPHSNYSSHSPSFNQQRPVNQSPLSMNLGPAQNRHMSQGPILATNSTTDQMKPIGSVTLSSGPNAMHSISPATCHSRTQLENSRLTPSTTSTASPFIYSKSSSNSIKGYENLFPPNSVEATQIDYSKKRKYCSKDIKAFNSTNVTMALKSGLVAEVSWALNHLNIWSSEDSFFDKLGLKNVMPMFQALIDVWRQSLGSVFGYDMFIKDLELPIKIDDSITKPSLEDILKTMEAMLRSRQIKQESSLDENSNITEDDIREPDENLQLLQHRIIEILNCGKYRSDKNGLSIILDSTAKFDSIFGTRSDFIDFVIGVCNEVNLETDKDSENKGAKPTYYKYPNFVDLWDAGGSDSTFHILPPLQTQRNNTIPDWSSQLISYNSCESDNCGPPEIKRSRSDSPSNISLSSPTLPNLLYDNYNHQTEHHRQFPIKSEVFSTGESLFFEIDDSDEDKMLRCLCVSMVIRNLSFIVGNDRIIGSNRCLLVIIGKLLLLGHRHDDEPECDSWWWHRWIDDIREHVFVTLINVAGFVQLETFPDGIVQPIVTGLIHWLICKSAEAEDPLPSHRVLGCRRLALECIMRLCVYERNIDYIVYGSSPKSTKELFDYLASSFCHPEVQVVKEMSLAVMHYLTSASPSNNVSIGCMYLANAEPSIIGGLITFIEVTESQIRYVVENMGMEALQARPELMGTSLELLRHSGALLHRIATCHMNRLRFSRDHEMRMLNLVISTVLDQTVAQSLSGVLYMLTGGKKDAYRDYSDDDEDGAADHSRLKSFLTFDDLSFCEKEVSCVNPVDDAKFTMTGEEEDMLQTDDEKNMKVTCEDEDVEIKTINEKELVNITKEETNEPVINTKDGRIEISDKETDRIPLEQRTETNDLY